VSLFVADAVDRLTFDTPADGPQWMDVRHRLNAGDYEELFESYHDDKNRLRVARVRRLKALAYLVAWSLTRDGEPVPISSDALRALEAPVFKQIAELIEAHEEKTEAEATARKNDQDGVAA
jgi:hypothetical protein